MTGHPIVHVDIPAEEPQVVSRFYAAAFNWDVHALPAMRYIRFQAADGQTGGFIELGGPLHHRVGEVLVYVASDDIDGDLQRIEELGGTILVPKTEIPRTGWFGIFQDPAGNRLGLFQRTGFVTE